jgi:ParB-like chromosome segregation protein Spo0J
MSTGIELASRVNPLSKTLTVARPGSAAAGEGAGVVLIPLKVLRDSDSPRLGGVDRAHVLLLADLDIELPPILVHRPTMRVIDGMHRLHAARLRGDQSIKATFFDGSEQECFVLAVTRNIKHGLPLTLADRRESARRILRCFPNWSNRAVAEKVGLSAKTVGALREDDGQLFRIGRDGRIRPLDPRAGRLRAEEALTKKPDASLREIARIVGVSIGTVRDVRERLNRGQSPLPQQHGGQCHAAAIRPNPPAPAAHPVDMPGAMTALRRDPSLCYSDAGRHIIRCLDARVVREEDVGVLTSAPVHQARRIAAIARACATQWHQIAEELERGGSRRN